MAIESTADRVLKLPLDSPFDTRDGENHSREPEDDNRDDAQVQQLGHQDQHQQEDPEQFDAVSLTGSVPPGFGNVTHDGLIHNGAETGKVLPIKKQQDTSLTAAAAAAVASIQDVWSENFSEPLPTNKEERIQQALEFMNSEKQAHDSDKNIKKHSIRQIALFFQVPKSTLYDRLKSKTNDLHANSLMKSLQHGGSSPRPHTLSASRSHQQQMKLSIEKEHMLLNEVRNLCHSYGNTLNYTHIREFIMSLVNGVSLGKKWIHNFTRRHDEFVIYGTYNSRFNVKMKKSKSCRCNFDYLWRCFVPLLQEKVKSLPQDKPFYYITRSCIHQASMSSVFACFEVIPNEMSIKSKIPPKLIIFPDYFGKIYLHQGHNYNKHKSNNDNNNNNDNSNSNNNISNDNEDENNNGLPHNDDSGGHRYKRDSLTSEINNDEGSLQDNMSDPSSRINKQERTHGQFKIDKLNEVFAKIYSECCQMNSSTPDHETSLVVFEGFDDRYNWNTLLCRDRVQTDKFLALPWNQQLFQQGLAVGLREAIDVATQSTSATTLESPFYEAELNDENLNLDIFAQELHHIINVQTELLNSDESLDHDSVRLNDLNVFGPALHAAATAASSSSSNSSNPDIQAQQNISLGKSTQPSHIESVTSANIFENSTISQLQDVINMIDTNESQLYGDLMSPNSKATLMTIFNKIKGIVPQ